MPTYNRQHIRSVDDLRNIADAAGSYFFSPRTMQFFSSRAHFPTYPVQGTAAVDGARFVFVTSERHGDEPRHYAVRVATLGTQRDDRPHVDIVTADGPYYASRQAAHAAAAALAAELAEVTP